MQVMQKMILVEAHVKWSVILMDLLGPDIFSRYEWKNKFCIVSERIWKFQVSQWFENELLTKKLPMVFFHVWMKLVSAALITISLRFLDFSVPTTLSKKGW